MVALIIPHIWCQPLAMVVSYPDPGPQQLRVDYITATWKEGLEECSHPVVPCAPDFRRTIRMQSTRDVTHGVLFNTNLKTHLLVIVYCYWLVQILKQLSYVLARDWATSQYVLTSTKLFGALWTTRTCL